MTVQFVSCIQTWAGCKSIAEVFECYLIYKYKNQCWSKRKHHTHRNGKNCSSFRGSKILFPNSGEYWLILTAIFHEWEVKHPVNSLVCNPHNMRKWLLSTTIRIRENSKPISHGKFIGEDRYVAHNLHSRNIYFVKSTLLIDQYSQI